MAKMRLSKVPLVEFVLFICFLALTMCNVQCQGTLGSKEASPGAIVRPDNRALEEDQATDRDPSPSAQDSISPSWTPKLFEENPPPSYDPFQNASFSYVYVNPENNSLLLEKIDFPQGKLDGKKESKPVEDNRAVCPNNQPLDALFPSGRDVCRVYINKGQDGWGICTGSFVYSYGETRWYTVVTAAHCLVDARKAWVIKPLDSAPSFVCCSALGSGAISIESCPVSYRFRIRAVTIPKSYTQKAGIVAIDDAAVLAVVPYESTVQNQVPYAWGFYLGKSICKTQDEFLYAGYPGLSDAFEGCTQNNIVRGYLHSSTTQGLLNCQQATSGRDGIIYPGSSCPGMSGGPLISKIDNTDAIVGILSGSSLKCSQSGTSATWFARTAKSSRVPGFQPRRLVRSLQYNKLKVVR